MSTNGNGRQGPSIDTALDWAEIAAMLGDYRDAVAWLEYVERMGGQLPSAFVKRRSAWASKAAES
jgi:hypothetical protein